MNRKLYAFLQGFKSCREAFWLWKRRAYYPLFHEISRTKNHDAKWSYKHNRPNWVEVWNDGYGYCSIKLCPVTNFYWLVKGDSIDSPYHSLEEALAYKDWN